jgi:hypothetical protein
MLETEPDPGPVLEQLSVSEHDRVREISVGLRSGHRTDPHESQYWRRSTYIVLFLVEDDFIEVQCGWHLRHLKWHLRRHLVRGDEDAAGDEDAG